MNLNLFDGNMIVQNILEKAVKGMYLVVRIIKKITCMERYVGQILNKTIMVIVFATSSGHKRNPRSRYNNIRVLLQKCGPKTRTRVINIRNLSIINICI